MSSSRSRKAAAKRREQKKRQRRMTLFIVIGVIVAFGVFLVFAASSAGTLSPGEYGDYSTYPQGVDETGAPYIGSLDAPAVLVEYGDFACSACDAFSDVAHELIRTYVADGSLRIVFKPMNFINPQTSPTAAQAGLCAADQDKFWEMHDALYNVRGTVGSNAFIQRDLIGMSGEMGLDEDAFGDCMNDRDVRATVVSFRSEAAQLGIDSTPTLKFNERLLTPGAKQFGELEQMILSVTG